MDYLRKSKCGINISETILYNLRFVGDIDLIDEECSSPQEQFQTIRIVAEEAGLAVNTA